MSKMGKLRYSYLVTIVVLLTISETQGWSGNYYKTLKRSYTKIEEYCKSEYMWGCSAWSHYNDAIYYDYNSCWPGWTHNGDENCVIPTCYPGCGTNGQCVDPGVCVCNSVRTGPRCQSSTCSFLRPCYPGDCASSTVCTCSVGFKLTNTSEGCTTFDSDPVYNMAPKLTRTSVTIAHMQSGGIVPSYKFTIEGGDTSGTNYYWINQESINRLQFQFDSLLGLWSDTGARPAYVDDSKLGVVHSQIMVTHTKPQNDSLLLRDVAYNQTYICEQNVSRDNPTLEVVRCDIDDTENLISIEHGDWLTVAFQSTSGGFTKLINIDQNVPYGTKYFQGLHTVKEVEFRFDFLAPRHCSEPDAFGPCPPDATILHVQQEFTKLQISREAGANSAERLSIQVYGGCAHFRMFQVACVSGRLAEYISWKKTSVTVRHPIAFYWSGWTDDLSGIQDYYVEIFKLEPDSEGRLVEKTPLDPVQSFVMPDKGSTIKYNLEYRPSKPGMYSILLGVRDRANNTRTARRFVLYDRTSSVQPTPNGRLYIPSAVVSPSNGYSWMAYYDGPVKIVVNWTEHFTNYIHDEGKLLNEILDYPEQFTDIENYGIRSMKKYVSSELDDDEGSRTKTGIPNYQGIIKFEIKKLYVYPTFHESSGWEDIPLAESTYFVANKSTGYMAEIRIRATDSIDNTLESVISLHFDSSPPVAYSHFMERNYIHDTTYYIWYHVRFGEYETGLPMVVDKLTIHTLGKQPRIVAELTSNTSNKWGWFVYYYEKLIDHCLFAVSRDDLPISSATIEVTAYNHVLLNTSVVFQIGNLTELNGLANFTGPTNIRIEDETPYGFRVTWERPEEDHPCYETAEIIIVLDETVNGSVETQKFSVNSSVSHLDIDVTPGTNYTVQFRMKQPKGEEVDFGFADLSGETPCLNGTYGIGCSFNCSQCLDGAVCDKVSGYCPDGCEPQWYGDACDILVEIIKTSLLLSDGDGYDVTASIIELSGLQNTSVRAIHGEQIHLMCTADLYTSAAFSDVITIQWWFGDILLQPETNSHLSINASAENNTTKESILTINSVSTKHIGLYTCTASSGPINVSKSVHVNVVSPVDVVMDPRSKTLDEGDALEIECTLVEYEESFSGFQWYRHGEPLQLRPGEQLVNQNTSEVLSIDTLIEMTTFGCEGINDARAGARDYSYIGVIHFASSKELSGIYNTTIRAIHEEEIQMTCRASAASSDVITIQWWFGDIPVQPGTNSRLSINSTAVNNKTKESVLTIRSALAKHTGLYTCMASNGPINVSKSVPVNVIAPVDVVMDPRSKTLEEGDALEIECKLVEYEESFSGFQWYRHGKPLQLRSDEQLDNKNTSEVLIIGNVIETTTFGCEGINDAGAGAQDHSYIGVIHIEQSKPCPAITEDGQSWPQTAPDSFAVLECDQGHTGEIKRFCDTSGFFGKPVYNCLKVSIKKIKTKLDGIKDGISDTPLPDIVTEMKNETSNVNLHNTDMEVMLEAMDIVADNTDTEQTVDTESGEKESQGFIAVASNMIGEQNKKTWKSRLDSGQSGAIVIPELVEKYVLKKVTKFAGNSTQSIFTNFNTSNIYVELGRDIKRDYELPLRRDESNIPGWLSDAKSKLQLDAASLNGIAAEYVTFTISMFRNITDILTAGGEQNGGESNLTKGRTINADIVSVQVKELAGKFSPPARIYFQHFSTKYSKPQCSYWDPTQKAFRTEGCHLISTSADKTVCACSHFTNFAVLMSPAEPTVSNVLALSIISTVGCAISIFCLLLTIVSHALVWRYVKSDKIIILMNLCTVLVLSYIVFLAGVGRTENKAACTAVSTFLQYFYLVVFFLMLAYGVEVAVSVVFVFDKRSYLKLLLALAWGIPLVIVVISLGSTKAIGYGNETFCWLSIDSGLVWAFVVPALTVITINIAIMATVLFKMFKMTAMKQKSEKERAMTAVRSVCVLTPIFGLTWLFGVFSVNDDLVAFQYIFAILNSLQGLFIFIFYCVLNVKVRSALVKLRERRKELSSIASDMKHPQGSESSSVMQSATELSEVSRYAGDTVSATMNPFYELTKVPTETTKMEPNHLTNGATTSNMEPDNTSNGETTSNMEPDHLTNGATTSKMEHTINNTTARDSTDTDQTEPNRNSERL